MKATVILKADDRIFDTNGKALKIQKVSPEEPYDPRYLEKEVDNTVPISRSEKREFRMLDRLTKTLRKAKVIYNWCEDEFRVDKEVGDRTLTRCLWVQDDLYCYGTDDMVFLETADVHEVISKLVKWMDSPKML